jgi:hypothetical protein
VRIYVGLKEYFKQDIPAESFRNDVERPSLRNIHSINVLEGTSLDGTFTKVETVKLAAQAVDYIEVHMYRDPADWFKLEFIDPEGKVLATTEPLVSEIVGSIVDKVRFDIGDTNLDDPAFTDAEFLQKIRLAVRRYKGEKNLSMITEDDLPVIGLLTRIDIASTIAYDHAKYFALQAPEAQLDKSQIMNHYFEVVTRLEEYWAKLKGDLGLGSGGRNDANIISEMPAPNVVTVSRVSMRSGRRVTTTQPILRPYRFI